VPFCILCQKRWDSRRITTRIRYYFVLGCHVFFQGQDDGYFPFLNMLVSILCYLRRSGFCNVLRAQAKLLSAVQWHRIAMVENDLDIHDSSLRNNHQPSALIFVALYWSVNSSLVTLATFGTDNLFAKRRCRCPFSTVSKVSFSSRNIIYIQVADWTESGFPSRFLIGFWRVSVFSAAVRQRDLFCFQPGFSFLGKYVCIWFCRSLLPTRHVCDVPDGQANLTSFTSTAVWARSVQFFRFRTLFRARDRTGNLIYFCACSKNRLDFSPILRSVVWPWFS